MAGAAKKPMWPHLVFGTASIGLFLFGAFFVIGLKQLEIGAFCLVFSGLGFLMWNRALRTEGGQGEDEAPRGPKG